MTPNRCSNFDCGRFVPVGQEFCPRHRPDSDDPAPSPYLRALRMRDFSHIAESEVIALVRQAASRAEADGVTEEIGALRLILQRLLTEQGDLDLLSKNVPHIIRAALDAARTRQALVGAPPNPVDVETDITLMGLGAQAMTRKGDTP